MTGRLVVAWITLILTPGCAMFGRAELPLCSPELRMAERDLSGAVPFDPASTVYETREGELCRAR